MSDITAVAKHLQRISPCFLVADVVASANYYRDVLGFRYDRLWGEPPEFAMVTRDGLTFMLQQAEKPEHVRPNAAACQDTWNAYIWIEDADALFRELTANGAHVAYEPVNRDYYDMREFAVKDIDGYVIGFGQPIPPQS